MADGPITVPAPKVVATEFKQERVLILRLQTVAISVQVCRVDGATQKHVQV